MAFLKTQTWLTLEQRQACQCMHFKQNDIWSKRCWKSVIYKSLGNLIPSQFYSLYRVQEAYVCVLSRFSHIQLLVTLWTVTHKVPLSMGFSRQEYWSGLPCSSPQEAYIKYLTSRSLLSHVLTLCDPVDSNPPGSYIHGIFQARILEQVAACYSRRSSQPRDQTCISCIGRRILYHCTTWEAPKVWERGW